jgi:hypothetical protein
VKKRESFIYFSIYNFLGFLYIFWLGELTFKHLSGFRRNANATVQCPVEKGLYSISQSVDLPKEIPHGEFQSSFCLSFLR